MLTLSDPTLGSSLSAVSSIPTEQYRPLFSDTIRDWTTLSSVSIGASV